MIFSSPHYWLFLGTILVLLAALRRHDPAGDRRRGLLCISSCLFYAAWDWRYLGLLLSISLIDWVAARKIHCSENGTREIWLVVSIASNLAILGYFKYANFFVTNFGGTPLDIVVPAGLSFYIFKTLSYTIDVYRRTLSPCKSWLNYLTFVTYFPDLIAGPIVRASVFLPQLDREIGPTRRLLSIGVSQFIQGLTKKFFVADRLAISVDPIFADPALYSSGSAWLALIGYSLQIYCDFSGYTDMALGSARMMGYELPQNFCRPYFCSNISDLWRRWHQTLSFWLRDYLYIPLGGSRAGELRTCFNLMITMIVSGAWHGGSWNCLVWGLMHGVALVGHRQWRRFGFALPTMLGIALTQFHWLVSLVWFRCPDLPQAINFMTKLVGSPSSGVNFVPTWLAVGALLVLLEHYASSVADGTVSFPGRERVFAILGLEIDKSPESGSYLFLGRLTFIGVYLTSLWLLLLFFFGPGHTNPFVYFKF